MPGHDRDLLAAEGPLLTKMAVGNRLKCGRAGVLVRPESGVAGRTLRLRRVAGSMGFGHESPAVQIRAL